MRPYLIILVILSTFSCQDNDEIEKWTGLTEKYSRTINEIKDRQLITLESRYRESPFKTEKYYKTANQLDKLIQQFKENIEIHSLESKELEKAYFQTLDSIKILTSTFQIKLDSSYENLPKLQRPEQYMTLNLTLFESQILKQFNDLTNTTFCGYIPLTINVSEMQVDDKTIKLDIESEGFKCVPKKYLTIDSITKNDRIIKSTELTEPSHSFFSIYFDSLTPGNYNVFGTVTGFTQGKKFIEKFEKEFKIKTGGNKNYKQAGRQ